MTPEDRREETIRAIQRVEARIEAFERESTLASMREAGLELVDFDESRFPTRPKHPEFN